MAHAFFRQWHAALAEKRSRCPRLLSGNPLPTTETPRCLGLQLRPTTTNPAKINGTSAVRSEGTQGRRLCAGSHVSQMRPTYPGPLKCRNRSTFLWTRKGCYLSITWMDIHRAWRWWIRRRFSTFQYSFRFFDEAGNQIGAVDAFTLLRRNHLSFTVTDRYPQTVGKRGTIKIESSSAPLSVLGFRVSPTGFFTSTSPISWF